MKRDLAGSTRNRLSYNCVIQVGLSYHLPSCWRLCCRFDRGEVNGGWFVASFPLYTNLAETQRCCAFAAYHGGSLQPVPPVNPV